MLLKDEALTDYLYAGVSQELCDDETQLKLSQFYIAGGLRLKENG